LSAIRALVIGLETTVRPPRITIALRTDSAIDQEKLKESLNASRTTKKAGKVIHHFSVGSKSHGAPSIGLDAGVWIPDGRTAVLALAADLESIRDRHDLPTATRELVQKRIPKDANAWLVANLGPDFDSSTLGSLLNSPHSQIPLPLGQLQEIALA